LQFVEQRAAADARRPGRFGAVEIALADCPLESLTIPASHSVVVFSAKTQLKFD